MNAKIIKVAIIFCVFTLWLCPAMAQEKYLTYNRVVVSYKGISKKYAKAIARTVSTARDIAVQHFNFDMADTIRVITFVSIEKSFGVENLFSITTSVESQGETELMTDGESYIRLLLHSQKDLYRPEVSRYRHVYGFCHEIGHMTMCRLTGTQFWSSSAAQSWAHYMGSRLIDSLYAREGLKLWPDQYDYSIEGMRLLKTELSDTTNNENMSSLKLWHELIEIVGDKNIVSVFRGWGKIAQKPNYTIEQIKEVLFSNQTNPLLNEWWNKAEKILFTLIPRSSLTAKHIQREKLSGHNIELSNDTDHAGGRWSITGGGHAVVFEAPDDSFYLTNIRLFGERYGDVIPPDIDFHIWLCDKNMAVISDLKFPYSTFQIEGESKWVDLDIEPMSIPLDFVLCADFNPTTDRGVYMFFDKRSWGHSYYYLPGGKKTYFPDGEWMIRAVIDKPLVPQSKKKK